MFNEPSKHLQIDNQRRHVVASQRELRELGLKQIAELFLSLARRGGKDEILLAPDVIQRTIYTGCFS